MNPPAIEMISPAAPFRGYLARSPASGLVDGAGDAEQILAEKTGDATPRYWEDVQVSDGIDTIMKGPLGLTDFIAFIAGGSAPIPRVAAHSVSLKRYHKDPKWAFGDPRTHALEPVYSVPLQRGARRAQDRHLKNPGQLIGQVLQILRLRHRRHTSKTPAKPKPPVARTPMTQRCPRAHPTCGLRSSIWDGWPPSEQ
jgi:hypothetical protein